MSSNLKNVVTNANNKFLSSEQQAEIDNIYKNTCLNLLSEFTFDFESSESNETPSSDELNNIDEELENAIRLLSSTSTYSENMEQRRKYNEVESFLQKYEGK